MPRDEASEARGETVEEELARLEAADRAALCAAWAEAFGSPPPRYTSLPFLRKALAYEVQCKAQGGMPKAMRRTLKAVLDGKHSGSAATGIQPARPGAVLVRDWNGRTCRVEVVDGGYRMDEHTYASLSAIARRITGTNWSGPRFFGPHRSQGTATMIRTRCAIYTRKSSEDGLEQEFNSLHAQREACAAFIASQRSEGWVRLPDHYDDGGLSGGTLDRPALMQVLQAVDDGLVDRIVVYKIDRLTRSLADFAKIVERLDAAGTSFVSVTQSFNTATSMGRLTLNMLLSFARFEREVTAERIRDKIAASKRKGLWMGGQVPLGYDPDGRSLKVRDEEAETVRTLYRLYLQHGTVRATSDAADELGLRSRRRPHADGTSRGGIPMGKGHVHHILTNPIYAGRIRHKGEVHDGQHPPIIDPHEWEEVQRRLIDGAAKARRKTSATASSPLIGKLFDETGDRLTPSHTRTRSGKRLRYFVSHRPIKQRAKASTSGWRLPAPDVEQVLARLVRGRIAAPDFAVTIISTPTADEILALKDTIRQAGDAQQDRFLPLIDRVDLAPGEINIRLATELVASLLEVPPDRLNTDALAFSAPFAARKRGVETKLVIGNEPAQIDPVLVRNIAQALEWYDAVKAGEDTRSIARRHDISPRRVQQLIEFAFLAPDVVRAILEGRQPSHLTSESLLRDGIPTHWSVQRRRLLAQIA